MRVTPDPDAGILVCVVRQAAREAGSDRRSQAARNRMRLIAQQIMPENGKKMPDDFGMRDEDWNVYHDMQGS